MVEKEIQYMGQDGLLKVSATFEFTGIELGFGFLPIEVPLEFGRNEFGKAIIIPDFTPVRYEIRKHRALGRIK